MGLQNYGFEQDSTQKDPSISDISMRQKYTKVHVFEAYIGSMARKYTKIHGLQVLFFRAFFWFRLSACRPAVACGLSCMFARFGPLRLL